MHAIIQTVKAPLPSVYKQVNQSSSPGFTPWFIKHKIGKVSNVILQLHIHFLGLWRNPSGASSARRKPNLQFSGLTSLDRGSVRVREEVLLLQRTNLQHTSIATSDRAGCPNTHIHTRLNPHTDTNSRTCKTTPSLGGYSSWGNKEPRCQHVILKSLGVLPLQYSHQRLRQHLTLPHVPKPTGKDSI